MLRGWNIGCQIGGVIIIIVAQGINIRKSCGVLITIPKGSYCYSPFTVVLIGIAFLSDYIIKVQRYEWRDIQIICLNVTILLYNNYFYPFRFLKHIQKFFYKSNWCRIVYLSKIFKGWNSYWKILKQIIIDWL